MKTLVENRIADEKVSEGSTKATIVIAHGNGSGRFTKAHDELKAFVKRLIVIILFMQELYMGH